MVSPNAARRMLFFSIAKTAQQIALVCENGFVYNPPIPAVLHGFGSRKFSEPPGGRSWKFYRKPMVRLILPVVVGFAVWTVLWLGSDQMLINASKDWYGAHQYA